MAFCLPEKWGSVFYGFFLFTDGTFVGFYIFVSQRLYFRQIHPTYPDSALQTLNIKWSIKLIFVNADDSIIVAVEHDFEGFILAIFKYQHLCAVKVQITSFAEQMFFQTFQVGEGYYNPFTGSVGEIIQLKTVEIQFFITGSAFICLLYTSDAADEL